MATVYTPESHHVWNELDNIGQFLNLERLDSEKNDAY